MVDHYSPLDAGLSLLPLTVIMLFLSARSGELASRIGPRLQMSAGPLVVGAGLVLLVRANGDSSYFSEVLPGVVVLGLGLATTVAPLTATALGSLPSEKAGLASAVNNDVSRVGGLMAVAVLPAIIALGGTAYLHRTSMAAGFRTGMIVTAACCAAGGAIAALGIRNPSRPPAITQQQLSHCALDAAPVCELGRRTPSC